ncbi:Retrovirus-related Pol polyprotein from transposon TNT 1-94 [Fusarium oxysporum f. sp. albedinis]|nr:hypothetical protein FOFC_21033 [Fusarium oxysporum]KAJ0136858.1 Retrovirus-related Pol polyprotein from transposon TNT 1-94 [Fusarium oxysporum f. sp. albedinis]
MKFSDLPLPTDFRPQDEPIGFHPSSLLRLVSQRPPHNLAAKDGGPPAAETGVQGYRSTVALTSRALRDYTMGLSWADKLIWLLGSWPMHLPEGAKVL